MQPGRRRRSMNAEARDKLGAGAHWAWSIGPAGCPLLPLQKSLWWHVTADPQRKWTLRSLCWVLIWLQHDLKQSQSCFKLWPAYHPLKSPRFVGRVGARITHPPQGTGVPWVPSVLSVKSLPSNMAVKGTVDMNLNGVFGFNGKNEKSYQKYYWDEKYDVFATHSFLGNRE